MDENQQSLIRIYGSQEHELVSLVAYLKRQGLDVEIEKYEGGGKKEGQWLFRISGMPEPELMSLAENLKRRGSDVEIVI